MSGQDIMAPGQASAAVGKDEFESAFANLAYSVLQSESPMLLDYLLGFELIDKNEDETHAIGVFGFKVGKQLLFAPVFFVNGQLKGNELLYVESLDVFVPRADKWVQYLLNRKPYILGESEPKSESQLGISVPDISRFSSSPTGGPRGFLTKYNADHTTYTPKFFAKWAKDSVGMFQWNNAKYACLTKLSQFMEDTVKQGTSLALATQLKQSPEFLESFVSVYPDIAPFLKRAAFDHFVTAESNPAKGKYDVVFADEAVNDVLLTDSDRSKLLRKEIVIKDHRTNTSNVYKADVGANLTNPAESGMYEVLLQDGKFEKAHIFIGPKVIGNGHCNVCLLVSPEDNKPWGYYYLRDLWVRGSDQGKTSDLYNSGVDVEDVNIGDVYFLVNEKQEASEPFRVLRKESNAQDNSLDLWVRPYEDYDLVKNRYGSDPGCCSAPPSYSSRYNSRPEPFQGTEYCSFYECSPGPYYDEKNDNEKQYWYKGRRITYNKDSRATSIVKVGKTTVVSPAFKAVKLNIDANRRSTWQSPDPGSIADLTVQLLKTGALTRLQVHNDGLRYHINIGNDQHSMLSKLASMKLLVRELNIATPDAENMLKEAGKKDYLVKVAVSAPAIPEPYTHVDSAFGAGVPTIENAEWLLPVAGMQAKAYRDKYHPSDAEPLPLARNSAALASQSGQQDIFDTSVIAGLVKTVKVDSVIDKYLSDIIVGLDRVGRLLFMFYWHADKFKERYGQEDLVELEDSLRNVFSGLGDLVLFLKQHNSSDLPMENSENIDLSAVL